MTKAVFTTNVTPSYDDLSEVRYHFPTTYLNYVRRAVGDYVVYYEPRRSSTVSGAAWPTIEARRANGPAVDLVERR